MADAPSPSEHCIAVATMLIERAAQRKVCR